MSETRTIYLGGLDSRVSAAQVLELGIQAGRVVRVQVPEAKGYGFIEYAELEDAAYALRLYRDLLCLYGKKVKVEYAGGRAAAASQYQQPPPEHRPARAQTTPPSYPAPYSSPYQAPQQYPSAQQHQHQQPPFWPEHQPPPRYDAPPPPRPPYY